MAATLPRSPRFLWAFGGNEPCDELKAILDREHIDSGALLADAFSCLGRLQDFAEANRCSAQATSQLAVAWARAHAAADAWARCGPRVSKACLMPLCSGAVVAGNPEAFTAKSLEDKALARVLDRAISLAWRIGASVGLLPELLTELKQVQEVNRLLRLILLGASGAVNTWRASVRAVERLERWSMSHGLSLPGLSGTRIAQFLSDAAEGGHSVPTSLRAGLKLMSDALLLKWPLEHPVVLAVCKLAKRSALDAMAHQETSSPCLTVEQLQHLEAIGCDSQHPLALRWGALLGCFLAHACLRFSDAQRSERIQLGHASLYGYCWRSKRRRTGFPFAALRAGFSVHPWAEQLIDFLTKFESQHALQLDFVLPQFGVQLDKPLVRPATYSCAVGLLRQALRLPPLCLSEGAAHQVTLHACRRLLPTLAGQMLMSIESRRVLGHWGPRSAEPLRYDTSRCVSELAYKAQVSSHVIAGWRPGADFEPPPPLPAELPPPLPAEPRPAAVALRQAPAELGNGWVANAQPHVKGRPRCVHNLAKPGVTKCGCGLGSTPARRKNFLFRSLRAQHFFLVALARLLLHFAICYLMPETCRISQNDRVAVQLLPWFLQVQVPALHRQVHRNQLQQCPQTTLQSRLKVQVRSSVASPLALPASSAVAVRAGACGGLCS